MPEKYDPLVSVIIPCFNNADMLPGAINSVLEQDYPNIEIIVVDDGSTDESIEVLKQFNKKITLIQQINQGPAAARNKGLQAAAGEFIAFNDSDDLWLPGKLTAQIDFLQRHPEFAMCYCGWMEWDGHSSLLSITDDPIDAAPTISSEGPASQGWLYTALLKESVIHTITAVLRKEVIDNIGLFNTDYRIGEDHDYWLRISRKYRIAKLSQVYALYRNNPNSITKKVHDKNYSLLILESAIANYGLNCPSGEQASQTLLNQYLGARHFTYGYNAMLQGDREKALSSFKGCIRYRHRLTKAVVFTILCSLPWLYGRLIKN